MIRLWPFRLRKTGILKPCRRSNRKRLSLERLEDLRLPALIVTVNTAADDPAGSTSGIVTLRDAITAVNNDIADIAASPDVINFNITDPPVIDLAADLPTIGKPVTIDGSTQAGVTVQGHGFAMLIDHSTATITSMTFTGGIVALGVNSILNVGAGATISAAGDLNAGDFASLNNHGNVSVSGNVMGGDFAGLNNFGAASLSVANGVILGADGYVYNGLSGTDSTSLTVGGGLSIGANGYVYQYGTSALQVTGDLTLGDDGYLYNGLSQSDAVKFTVGGKFGIGADGYIYSYGGSSIDVTGDLTLGNNGYLYNGRFNSDTASLIVGGSLSIGDATAGASDSGFAYNYGKSTFEVKGNFIIYGDGGSYVYNGLSNADTASLIVRGGMSLGTDSSYYNYGTTAFHGSLVVGAIVNDSAAAVGVLFAGAHEASGGIDGAGNSVLAADGNLTVGHVVQNSLAIGAGDVVTIAASDASGNPLIAAQSATAESIGPNAAIAAPVAALSAPYAVSSAASAAGGRGATGQSTAILELPVSPTAARFSFAPDDPEVAHASSEARGAPALATNAASPFPSTAAVPILPAVEHPRRSNGTGRVIIDSKAADNLFDKLEGPLDLTVLC